MHIYSIYNQLISQMITTQSNLILNNIIFSSVLLIKVWEASPSRLSASHTVEFALEGSTVLCTHVDIIE